MRDKETLREPAEYLPSRSTVLIVVAVFLVAVSAFAYYTYQYVQRHTPREQSAVVTPSTTPEPQELDSPEIITAPEPQVSVQFRCDGRTRCSQMTSCAEARFFLTNCPGTQMDGDNDGIPCEQQWCNGPF